MNLKPNLWTLVLIALLASPRLAAFVHAAQPQPEFGPATAFTYQGQLKRAGQLATATCGFRFGLWDSPSDGGQAPSGTACGAAA
jgi:hypothetical protein